MKPIVTWVLIANAKGAKIVVNEGPGKGFVAEKTAVWTADPAIEHSDAPTLTHSSVGHGQRRVERASPEAKAEADFAALLSGDLLKAKQRSAFDRLILVAAPHMLGELRQHLSKELAAAITAEVPKDLTGAPVDDLPKLLQDYIAA